MKSLLNLIVFFSFFQLFTSCNNSDEEPANPDLNYPTDPSINLNYTMDCNLDSTYYYYTLNDKKTYLDISTLCVSINFKNALTEAYRNYLLENNPELGSISIIDSEENIAFGYLKEDISCEETQKLLTRLTQESEILCANPNFIAKESVARGRSLNDEDCLMGLTNEFVVKLKHSWQTSELTSLINETNTKLVYQNELFTAISADKNSMGNSLEMSRYFYETGYFEFAHPNFMVKLILDDK